MLLPNRRPSLRTLISYQSNLDNKAHTIATFSLHSPLLSPLDPSLISINLLHSHKRFLSQTSEITIGSISSLSASLILDDFSSDNHQGGSEKNSESVSTVTQNG